MASSSLAKSATVRAMGPDEPIGDGYPSYIPLRLTRPGVGLIPTTSFQVEGRRIDAKVSSPIARVERFALRHAAEPPDEPPVVRSRSYGLRLTPKRDPYASPPPNSPSVVLPRMIAPAFLNFATTKESSGGL